MRFRSSSSTSTVMPILSLFQMMFHNPDAFSITSTNNHHHHHVIHHRLPWMTNCKENIDTNSLLLQLSSIVASKKQIPSHLSSSAKDDNSSSEGGGWYDDYDDFVSNLNFEGGGWDNSGASINSSSITRGDANSYSFNRGGDRNNNSDRSSTSSRSPRGRGGGRTNRNNNGVRKDDNYNNSYYDDHDYQRDTSRDESHIPEETVSVIENLLVSRLQFRKKRMFSEADGIRDELLNVHGVTVWDKEKTWFTTGGGGGGGGTAGGERGDRTPRSNDRGRREGRGERGGRGGVRRENKFNEYGHDYSQVGGPINPLSCTLSESEIHDKIRSRLECKFARDFSSADRIEYELKQAGVLVHDGFKEWRADGEEQDKLSSWGGRGRGGGGGGRNSDERRGSNRLFGSGPKPPKVYIQRGPGDGLSAEDIATINALVTERSEAKSTMDYDRADEIFDQLTNEYNINIDDKSGEWALLHEEYQLNVKESSFVPDKKVQAMIGKKLGERILARKARNFDLADDIRDELMNDFVVEIDDRAKEWMVVEPRGGQWSSNADESGDYDGISNIVSKEEWEEEDDVVEDGDGNDNDIWTEKNDISIESLDGDNDYPDSNVMNSVSTPSTMSETALLAMTVPELKAKLREAGLPLSGRKSELILRLLES